MREISAPGSEGRERASALLDSVFAIAILSIGIAGAAAVLLGSARVVSGSLAKAVEAIGERNSREIKVFDAR